MSEPEDGRRLVDQALEIRCLKRALADSRELVARHQARTQHRVRNLLSVVRAINSRSFERAVSLEELGMHQSGRISALARVEEALDFSDGVYVDLERLLWDEWFVVVSGEEEERVRAEGPRVALTPRAAERLGLAFHELTTNALKFGALSGRTGAIDVKWTLGPERLDILWAESDVPLLNLSPMRTGFGRDLIEHALPYDLQAESAITFAAGGIRCDISLPIGGNVVADVSSGLGARARTEGSSVT